MIKDVCIINAHSLQTLIETGEQIFLSASISIWSGPHRVTRLRGNKKFVAVATEVTFQDLAQCLFRSTCRWSVIIREVEMGDAMIECSEQNFPAFFKRVIRPEILPQSDGKGG